MSVGKRQQNDHTVPDCGQAPGEKLPRSAGKCGKQVQEKIAAQRPKNGGQQALEKNGRAAPKKLGLQVATPPP